MTMLFSDTDVPANSPGELVPGPPRSPFRPLQSCPCEARRTDAASNDCGGGAANKQLNRAKMQRKRRVLLTESLRPLRDTVRTPESPKRSRAQTRCRNSSMWLRWLTLGRVPSEKWGYRKLATETQVSAMSQVRRRGRPSRSIARRLMGYIQHQYFDRNRFDLIQLKP